MYGCVGNPICCPPEYCVRDYYTQRIIPVIHPVVNINRQNIVDVPQHYYQPTTRNVVVNQGFSGGQGYPGSFGNQGNFGYPGYSGPLFFR
jgi:spore coat protein D